VKTLKDQWFRFPRKLLESPAWSVLNIHERRAFDRIMEEHQSKSGFIHDGLVVTYRDFVKAGIQSRHVARSLRVLRQLGIIDCTRNMGGSASGRTPNMWRPTFLPRTPTSNDATHDYLEVKTLAEAKRIAVMHRIHETRKHRLPPARPRRHPALAVVPSASPLKTAAPSEPAGPVHGTARLVVAASS
jgi:hypothetical protein